jgi:hypothetical protein
VVAASSSAGHGGIALTRAATARSKCQGARLSTNSGPLATFRAAPACRGKVVTTAATLASPWLATTNAVARPEQPAFAVRRLVAVLAEAFSPLPPTGRCGGDAVQT